MNIFAVCACPVTIPCMCCFSPSPTASAFDPAPVHITYVPPALALELLPLLTWAIWQLPVLFALDLSFWCAFPFGVPCLLVCLSPIAMALRQGGCYSCIVAVNYIHFPCLSTARSYIADV